MSYTYHNPKDGKTITSDLTPMVARDIIKNNAPMSDGFAHDLARRLSFSESQSYWIILKAEKYNPANINKPVNQGMTVGEGFKRIQEMFALAKQSLKRPKIRLKNEEDLVEISLAPDTGRNAGFIYIKTNKDYAGKISPTGEFFPVQTCTPATKDYLKEFSKNPEAIAAKYGRETGNCCFCAKDLTDSRSVNVGYGKICAGKYGLDWG